MRKIRITAGSVTVIMQLNDSPTADAVWQVLPLQARGNTWGDEIYFGIPVFVEEEPDARDEVALGEVGYWPPGHAFCLFFGLTPMSQGNEIIAASPVNVIGQIEGDPTVLTEVPHGTLVCLEQVND